MRPNATSQAPRRLLTGRRIATILVLMVALLPAIAYSLWWWQAARTVRNGLESWVADQRANGAVVGTECHAVRRIGDQRVVYRLHVSAVRVVERDVVEGLYAHSGNSFWLSLAAGPADSNFPT